MEPIPHTINDITVLGLRRLLVPLIGEQLSTRIGLGMLSVTPELLEASIKGTMLWPQSSLGFSVMVANELASHPPADPERFSKSYLNGNQLTHLAGEMNKFHNAFDIPVQFGKPLKPSLINEVPKPEAKKIRYISETLLHLTWTRNKYDVRRSIQSYMRSRNESNGIKRIPSHPLRALLSDAQALQEFRVISSYAASLLEHDDQLQRYATVYRSGFKHGENPDLKDAQDEIYNQASRRLNTRIAREFGLKYSVF